MDNRNFDNPRDDNDNFFTAQRSNKWVENRRKNGKCMQIKNKNLLWLTYCNIQFTVIKLSILQHYHALYFFFFFFVILLLHISISIHKNLHKMFEEKGYHCEMFVPILFLSLRMFMIMIFLALLLYCLHWQLDLYLHGNSSIQCNLIWQNDIDSNFKSTLKCKCERIHSYKYKNSRNAVGICYEFYCFCFLLFTYSTYRHSIY